MAGVEVPTRSCCGLLIALIRLRIDSAILVDKGSELLWKQHKINALAQDLSILVEVSQGSKRCGWNGVNSWSAQLR
jgi:hypothetical protein